MTTKNSLVTTGEIVTDYDMQMYLQQRCKKEMGLKIHQAWMTCLVQETAAQRTGLTPGEAQEELSLEIPRRAQNLQVPSTPNSKQSSPAAFDQVSSSKAAQAVATV